MFIVKNKQGDFQLMVIKVDPWKNIDRAEIFDEPESVFNFQGSIGIPKDFEAPLFKPRLFSADKIRDVQLLQETIGKS